MIVKSVIVGFALAWQEKLSLMTINISGLTEIHQFTRIGEHCMAGGLSKIGKGILPYIIAAREPLSFEGINVVGLSDQS